MVFNGDGRHGGRSVVVPHVAFGGSVGVGSGDDGHADGPRRNDLVGIAWPWPLVTRFIGSVGRALAIATVVLPVVAIIFASGWRDG